MLELSAELRAKLGLGQAGPTRANGAVTATNTSSAGSSNNRRRRRKGGKGRGGGEGGGRGAAEVEAEEGGAASVATSARGQQAVDVDLSTIQGGSLVLDVSYPWPAEKGPAKERQRAVVAQVKGVVGGEEEVEVFFLRIFFIQIF